MVASGLVAFESFTHSTPPAAATGSSRCGGGRNARSAVSIAASGTPAARAAAAAASAFSRLCSPRRRACSQSIVVRSAAVNHTRAPAPGSAAARSTSSSPFRTAVSPSRWFSRMRSLQRVYSARLPCRSRWSGVTFRITATRQRSRSMSSSWKLESSQAIHVCGSTRPARSDSGRPTLPATSHSRPPAMSIAPSRWVVVVLPFVPVTPAIGFSGSIRAASSTSLQTGTPAARAAATCGTSPGTPGLFTSAVNPAAGTTSPPNRGSIPSASSRLVSTSGLESVAITSASGHTRAIASHAARPERRRPTTR